jgi:hypothetical protein
MSDEHNPYASPRIPVKAKPVVFDTYHDVPYPALSRLLTCCLAMNALSIPLSGLLPELRNMAVDRNQLFFADIGGFFVILNVLWVLVGWPLGSLSALLYTSTKDRGARWWLPKSIVAGLMLTLWLLGCGLFGLMIGSSEGGF